MGRCGRHRVRIRRPRRPQFRRGEYRLQRHDHAGHDRSRPVDRLARRARHRGLRPRYAFRPRQMRHILGEQSATIASTAAEPGFTPNVTFTRLGEHQLYTAIIAPSPESPYAHAEKLPVLMKPYGGPGFQQVIASQSFYWEGQWWADQGFLVVTADGRGTTGRGPAWDREIFEDMKDVTLADQSRPSTPCPRPSPGSTPMWNHVRHSRCGRSGRRRDTTALAPPPASGRRFPCRTSTRCA